MAMHTDCSALKTVMGSVKDGLRQDGGSCCQLQIAVCCLQLLQRNKPNVNE